MNELAELKRIEQQVGELQQAFLEIQQPRTDFELQHFVVGAHDTEPRQYAQCVLEMQIKYDNIRRALLNKEKVNLEIGELRREQDPKSEIEAKLKEIDLEEQDRAFLGAIREFKALYAIFKSFKKQYSRDDLNKDEINYWNRRLSRQAALDESANGRVGVGNLDALRMLGYGIHPQLSHVQEVEKRFLEQSNPNQKILLAMATEQKLEVVPEQFKIEVPSGWQVKFYNCYGRTIDAAYTDIVQTALNDNAALLLTIEDDTFPPKDALCQIIKHWYGGAGKTTAKSEGYEIVGAWYPKRTPVREGTPIVVKDGIRQHLEDDGKLHEVWTIPFGFTLFDTRVFRKITQPWFVTTGVLTQDSFFCQKAREAGLKLWCDTSIRCEHRDRSTGTVYK